VVQKSATPGDDDFEVAPAAVSDDDVDMWDAENENEDEIRQAHIKSMPMIAPLPRGTDFLT
jgi:AdoMet-dependent rRNA methyltransferase SPB1